MFTSILHVVTQSDLNSFVHTPSVNLQIEFPPFQPHAYAALVQHCGHRVSAPRETWNIQLSDPAQTQASNPRHGPSDSDSEKESSRGIGIAMGQRLSRTMFGDGTRS
jgi:hypothetical protein